MGLTARQSRQADCRGIKAGQTFDLVVIGGGINGAGIVRDAAGRGLKVLLCEKDDFAQHTSSASSKLIHGGLRYLEHHDYKLVRHSLLERETLLRMAPHIIWPMRFVLPHHRGLRPKWMIAMGLCLYDCLAPRHRLGRSGSINLKKHVAGEGLKPDFTHAFEYADCWVQDARLVILNVMDAHSRGATVLSRTRCVNLSRVGKQWKITLVENRGKETETFTVAANAVINAAGPWVDEVSAMMPSIQNKARVRRVRGSHIVVSRQFSHNHPYLFQNRDKRILFAIPFENDFTLIGTTDVEVTAQQMLDGISEAEIAYLCSAYGEYAKQPIEKTDVVWAYSGVRPLYDDASRQASKVTRDYVLVEDCNGAPIISVYGGKITTYRKLAEDVLELLGKKAGFERAKSENRWTAVTCLPGGNLAAKSIEDYVSGLQRKYPALDFQLLDRYARHYGTESESILQGARTADDLGQLFGADLFQAEVDYLLQQEYAKTAEDILWRRTRRGLKMQDDEVSRLNTYLDQCGLGQ